VSFCCIISFVHAEASSGEYSTPADIKINVLRLIEVDPVVQADTEAAIAAVWQRHMNVPASVNLTFAHSIVLKMLDGSVTAVNSFYQWGTDTIMIALGTLQERHRSEPLEHMAVLHAGHEARHKVQVALDNTPPDANAVIAYDRYTDSQHEVEAWESAIQAFSHVYPEQPVNFQVGSRVYSNQLIE